MKPRLLIFGARGFLGEHLTRAASADYTVFRVSSRPPETEREFQADIADPAAVRAAMTQAQPSYVALLAALSDIDRCENDPALTEAVNVQGAIHVARECARVGARLLFTSTAAVFSGDQESYGEEDAPTPLSVYGRSKARAEAAILEFLPETAVLRIGLAVGFAEGAGTNAQYNRMRADLAAGKTIAAPTFEIRNPIDARTLSAFMLEALANPAEMRGLLHIGASEPISRFDLATEFARRLGYEPSQVIPQTEPIAGRAPRGRRQFLRTEKIAALCRIPIPTCAQVLERSLSGTAESPVGTGLREERQKETL